MVVQEDKECVWWAKIAENQADCWLSVGVLNECRWVQAGRLRGNLAMLLWEQERQGLASNGRRAGRRAAGPQQTRKSRCALSEAPPASGVFYYVNA